MAKKPKQTKEIEDIQEVDLSVDDSVPRPRLLKLVIKNFRSIGKEQVEIDLDDIVVLVGPNNAGKSSILRAYEVVMSHGSKEGKLEITDFPNGIVEKDHLPEIELHTVIFSNAPGEQWINKNADGEMFIKEVWKWDSPNKDPVRKGWDVKLGLWSDKVPWGAPNVANSRRPIPHRIDAFASPDSQTKEISNLITQILKDNLASFKSNPEQEKSDHQIILEHIKALQNNAVTSTKEEVSRIEKEISEYISRIFPEHQVLFDAKPENDLDKAYTPFKNNADLLMGKEGGYFSPIEKQGSGARRTILWAVLKYLSESKSSKSTTSIERPHVLLLDEPEICLHPTAIREAANILYELPKTGKWQVMITSHSPIFIDLSRDNTTIIRVDRDEDDNVNSTTLFKPKIAKLDEDDKKNLKLLNICDPYVHEFFFGGKQVIVEGDTEYTAFSFIKSKYPSEYKNIHIIRARGKGIIPSIAKVLIQFSKSFTILHDTDTPINKSGGKNSAWGTNTTIVNILKLVPEKSKVKIVACKTCFETAIFQCETKSDKPYSALEKIKEDVQLQSEVKLLLDYLIGAGDKLPLNCIDWKAIEEIM